jgi:hypothetical protein
MTPEDEERIKMERERAVREIMEKEKYEPKRRIIPVNKYGNPVYENKDRHTDESKNAYDRNGRSSSPQVRVVTSRQELYNMHMETDNCEPTTCIRPVDRYGNMENKNGVRPYQHQHHQHEQQTLAKKNIQIVREYSSNSESEYDD